MICSVGIKKYNKFELKNSTREKHDKLNSSSAVTPSFYGLAKIHEEGNPIRPIVFFCSSSIYEISKILSKIITPITNLGKGLI